jgi:hypothetical protein
MIYAYRICVEYPGDWDSGVPDAAQDAIDLFRDANLRECTERSRADAAARFWRRLGAEASVERSNPVTWPRGSS